MDLEAFSIYRPHQTRQGRSDTSVSSPTAEKLKSNELVSLYELSDRGSTYFLLDGILAYDGKRRYIQGVPFKTLSIGAYEDLSLHTVGSQMWIQSVCGTTSNIWYCLKSPTFEYRRYHIVFLWLTDLAKHVIDYINSHDTVLLRNFRDDFWHWLQKIHGFDKTFNTWISQYGKRDFRQAIIANVAFLYNQAAQIGRKYISCPLWGEIDPIALSAVPRQPVLRIEPTTIVTPFVFDCFRDMPWINFLQPVTIPRTSTLQSTPWFYGNAETERIISEEGPVRTGDIVAVPSDKKTDWKTKDDYWIGYIQGQSGLAGRRRLNLIWLYRPTDTACQDMRYPYNNELFLSDHCNCGDRPIYATEVLRKLRVGLFSKPGQPNLDYFIRQKYDNGDCAWTSLCESDFHCQCIRTHSTPNYHPGDTLLIRTALDSETLEPAVFLGFISERTKVRVRRLLQRRKQYSCYDAEPNELVYTYKEEVYRVGAIARRCYVRFHTPEDKNQNRIPTPYNRGGTADCYYILYEDSLVYGLTPIQLPGPLMNQGFISHLADQTPLRGLDIFCGGGNFGRGLEDCGAVKNEWAVDYLNEAIHTYKANADLTVKLYNGSVNDFLLQAINGRGKGLVAQRGEVEFLLAGSPCWGFSIANRHYLSGKSLLNNSLVASVVAFIDFYRPKYAILENVLGMANSGSKRSSDGNNVLSQIICAIVALGYQVRPFILDAWSFGAPQSRTRIFISVAAPGLPLLSKPPCTHSHPSGIVSRSLGKTPNGLPFGYREFSPTPFEFVTIGEATKDLPEGYDGRTICIPFPDHRVSKHVSFTDHVRLTCVPRFPPAMSFVKSALLGYQPPPQMKAWLWTSDMRSNPHSKSWQRVLKNALLPTVTATCAPTEALTGAIVHWDQQRCMTVMEARRAQGIPDVEVIIGSPAMQWRIIGNGVARQVATALGMSLREAWLASPGSRRRTESPDPLSMDYPRKRTKTQASIGQEISAEVKSTVLSGEDSLKNKSLKSDGRAEHTDAAALPKEMVELLKCVLMGRKVAPQ